jgi:hypothetical protein
VDGDKEKIIFDGTLRDSGDYVTNLGFSGQRFCYVLGQGKRKLTAYQVVLEGKTVQTHEILKVFTVGRDGCFWWGGSFWSPGAGDSQEVMMGIYRDGERVFSYSPQFLVVMGIYSGPKGKLLVLEAFDVRYLLKEGPKKVANPSYYLVNEKGQIAGKKLSPPVFSPDGKRVIYAVYRDNTWRAVVDGRAERGFTFDISDLAFSPDGRHYLYRGVNIEGDSNGVWVLDGEPLPSAGRISRPRFLPDGTLACLAVRGGTLYRLAGKPQEPGGTPPAVLNQAME